MYLVNALFDMSHTLQLIRRHRSFLRKLFEGYDGYKRINRRNLFRPDSIFSIVSYAKQLHRTFSSVTKLSLPAAEKYDFHYPKAKSLFERITNTMTAKDVELLADEVNKILGHPLRKNEFYYTGFGGVGKRADGGQATMEESEQQSQPQTVAPSVVDLKLASFDASAKIKVIKEIRSIAGLGLKEAKELVESAPKVIQKGLKPEDAEVLKKKLEEVGAVIELV